MAIKDLTGKDLFVGDLCIMWRPAGLDTVRLVKYNEESKMMGVELVENVDGRFERSRFSTPYHSNKFYKL